VQLALFIVGVAAARWLVSNNIRPHFAGGHSIGAYAAAVTANVLTFEQGLQLVKKRAQLMVQFAPQDCGMAVLAGAPLSVLEDLVGKQNRAAGPIFVANVNSPEQIVVAGRLAELNQLLENAQHSGLRRAQLLKICVPSHTPWMQAAAEAMLPTANSMTVSPCSVPCCSNISGRLLYRSVEILEDLVWGIACPVNWIDCMSVLREAGSHLFLELPPGNVLTRIARSRFPECRCMAFDETNIGSLRIASLDE
jgi:malonate decarboxylase epsilon subunit